MHKQLTSRHAELVSASSFLISSFALMQKKQKIKAVGKAPEAPFASRNSTNSLRSDNVEFLRSLTWLPGGALSKAGFASRKKNASSYFKGRWPPTGGRRGLYANYRPFPKQVRDRLLKKGG